jgi:hypothetical protein
MRSSGDRMWTATVGGKPRKEKENKLKLNSVV